MEPKILASYTRQYSEIPSIQRASRVEYTLCRTGKEMRLVVRVLGARKRAAVCELPGMDAAYACGVLQYLYENAVKVEHVRDVIQDLRPEARDHLFDGTEEQASAPERNWGDTWPVVWASAQ